MASANCTFAPNKSALNRRRSAHRRLRASAGLALDPNACLTLRFAHADCSACKDACPTGAIRLDHSRFELDESCMSCGRCARACPTEALIATDFAALAYRGEVTYDCWKAPREESPAGASRVPCLAGIKLSEVFEHLAENKSVAFVDRGWCAECACGRDLENAASTQCMAVNAVVAQLNIPAAPVARVVSAILPRERMRTGRADALAERKIGRRDFFRGFSREAADAVSFASGAFDCCDVSADEPAAAGKILPRERLRRLAALKALTAREQRTLPTALLPSVRIAPQCGGHSVCAAVCPTGALRQYAEKDVRGIGFEPRLCISCGACARACPEHALAFSASGEDASMDARLLTHWRTRTCIRCQDDFTAATDAPLCDRCRKAEQLARSAFMLLARRGRESPTPAT